MYTNIKGLKYDNATCLRKFKAQTRGRSKFWCSINILIAGVCAFCSTSVFYNFVIHNAYDNFTVINFRQNQNKIIKKM